MSADIGGRDDATVVAMNWNGDRPETFLGFEIDEKTADRLAALKREGQSPVEALRISVSLGSSFDRESVAKAIGGDSTAAFTVVPGARKMKSPMPDRADDAVRALASALVPFAEHYPVPFFGLRDTGKG